MDIVFVILHYLTENETIESVNHIKRNIDTNDYKIIIVDNYSPNDSYDILRKEYESDINVELVKTEENLGFAKGNNVGYRLAKEKYKPDYIVLLNNDVYVKDKNFLSKLNTEYEKSHFAVAGPGVEDLNGIIEKEPQKWEREFPTIDYCNFRINDMKERILFGKLGLYRKVCPFLRTKVNPRLHIFHELETPVAGKKVGSNYYDVVIHGCCLVFSREYIDNYDGLDERTFMYGEERILFAQVLGNKQHTVFMPDIHVFHKGAVATKKATKQEKGEKQFVRAFERDKLSYEITKEYLEKFKQKNGMELHQWWEMNEKEGNNHVN